MTNAPLVRSLQMSFEETLKRVPEALKTEGFGVLHTIDMKATLKAKLDVNLGGYTIFGACNPKMAYEALQLDPSIGLRLPCNVLVRDLGDGKTEVSAIDPVETIGASEKANLAELAGKVREMLARVVAAV